jgi:hypothetical protein
VAGERDVPHMGLHHATALPEQVHRFAGHDGVAPALGLAHHGEGGVFVDLERFQGIANKKKFHRVQQQV